ncbi:MAG: sulfite exporter TauE/SafE family protein [Alphaproteobacteria bacterium]|jgi:uncharacterized protein|nr:sulfite exporter TauE/SafE family protein [Alphaproteobacteria bacterium]
MTWLFILLVGLGAGTLSGIIGFGGSTILMPILVLSFGPKAAVPIMAIAAILGNLSRVLVWWSTINWRAVAAYSVAAAPAAALGARVMLAFDPVVLDVFLGAFFIVMIPLRRWFASHGFKVSLVGLFVAGGIIGFLTGIVANTGPINTPFFLAHGLVKGAFISTEAMSSLFMFTSKAVAFRQFGALPSDIIVNGMIVGSTLMLGAWIAKRFVLKMDDSHFRGLMDVILFIAGGAMIFAAFY